MAKRIDWDASRRRRAVFENGFIKYYWDGWKKDSKLGSHKKRPDLADLDPGVLFTSEFEDGPRTLEKQRLVGPTEHAQWLTDGPVVVSTSGEVLGTLSTLETSTTSLFNETILEQVPFIDRCEACIGSLNDSFSTEGPKIYDSQSSDLKEKIGELTGQSLGEEP